MCRFLAYAGPPVFLDELLVRPSASLIAQASKAREAKTAVNADGCGVGWYGERSEPGLYRGVLPAWSDANLVSLCRQIRSRLFLAHVRAATFGEVATANCHPFAHGRHLFMHNGQVGGYERLRRRMDALIPDDLYAARKGTSDSEALFLAAVGQGLDRDPVGAIARTLRDIVALARDAGEADEPLRFAAVHTDGETLHAYRWASDGNPPSLYCREEGEGIVVASEPCDEGSGFWTPVPSGTLLTVERRSGARLRMFDPLAEEAERRVRAA
ncbi:class II glutamine amidotransferase [Aureimonas leprariae]|uniref:Class II glutamine amidotransferase n=1 Tax=Plantimonas leprariae TaxID=2615207 RepID=A0A7V7PNR5_9HYPH|nr:class II glutamine amidotransferase [Aureimonas leprariae]KAB0679425.1 class II glutamine amidotransferase [Aureimonas leprariae]